MNDPLHRKLRKPPLNASLMQVGILSTSSLPGKENPFPLIRPRS